MVSDNGYDRIYIGGLDPFKLKVDEVLKRLGEQLPESFKLENVFYSSQKASASYVHFTVVPTTKSIINRNDNIEYYSRNNHSDEDNDLPKSKPDAFEQICKLFHNVKWKGCKLKVERAKPHFLDRLRKEIEDRKQLSQRNTETTENSNVEEAENDNPDLYSIPRYLKVKRGYGEECWKVDTKPFSVNDWRSFNKLTNQVKTKREAYKESTNGNQMDKGKNSNLNLTNEKGGSNNGRTDMTYYNRSIHLRFVDPNDVNNKDDHVVQSTPNDDDDQVLKRYNNVTTVPRLSGTDYSDESNENATTRHDINEFSDSDDSSANDSVHNSSEMEKESTNSTGEPRKGEPTEYDNGIEEFAESSDEEESENDGNRASDAENSEECNSVTSLDLNKDIANNLSILSQMFPDMIRRKESSKSNEPENLNRDTSKKESQSKTKVGWTDSGQILRYDPKSFSIQQQKNEKIDTVKETVPSEGDDDETSVEEDIENNSNSMKDNDDEEIKMNDNEITTEDTTSRPLQQQQQNVYDQQKLEDVFREAREGSMNHQYVFGFLSNVDNPPPPPPVQNFTFGFSLPTENVTTQDSFARIAAAIRQSEDTKEHNDESLTESNPNRLSEEVTQRPSRKRVRAYELLEDDNDGGGSEVLNKIVDFTYSGALAGGEGSKILDNLERYRADSAVTEAWNKQRKWLTSDWKQKVKQVQANKHHHQFNKRGRSK